MPARSCPWPTPAAVTAAWHRFRRERWASPPRSSSRTSSVRRDPTMRSSVRRRLRTAGAPARQGTRPSAGISTMRGARSPESGRAEDVAEKIARELSERELTGAPVGVDVVEPPVMFALQRAGIEVVDGQQLMQRARVIKTQDEITLLDTACMMVDAAYDELYRQMRPGVRENECVGLVSKVLYDLGSEHVEGVNAISGERCNPHPHVFSDRALRPGDPAYFDILHSYNGYRTCYYRTFAVGSASQAMVDAYK